MIDKDKQIAFSDREMSLALAGVILGCFFCFVVGYFLGRQQDLSDATKEEYKELFADQITSSMYSFELGNQSKKSSLVMSRDVLLDATMKEKEVNENQEIKEESLVSKVDNNIAHKKDVLYRAQLIGFSTKKAAQKCVENWEKKGIKTEITKKTTVATKGKSVNWYQVVTLPYEDKQQLDLVVDLLIKQEKLQGVRIITC